MVCYNWSHFEVQKFFPIECALPSSWRRYWFPPRSLANDQASPSSLSQNSTTLFLSSCTQVPSELTTWYTNNTLYPYSHTLNTLSLTQHIHTLFINPHQKKKKKKFCPFPCQPQNIHVITAQAKQWQNLYYSRSLTCKHSIYLIDTYKIHSSHEFDFVYQQTLRDKTDK